MRIQIKGFCFVPFLTLFFILSSAHSLHAQGSSKFVQISEEQNELRLETAICTFEKGGKALDLIGVIHLADESYYTLLNEKMQQYERVFFEMVGNGKPQAEELHSPPKEEEVKDQLGVLSQMYGLYQGLLQLSAQQEEIDYSAPRFVHADLSREEFQELQAQHNESIMGYALSQAEAFQRVDQAVLLSAMISGDSTLLKKELMPAFIETSELGEEGPDQSVIIGARNQRALTILYQELEKHPELTSLALFYGAAHLPDFARRLQQAGWKETRIEWLPAWSVMQ